MGLIKIVYFLLWIHAQCECEIGKDYPDGLVDRGKI